MGDLFGGGETTQTVRQERGPITAQEAEAQDLALQSLRLRNWLLPLLLQEGGYRTTPEGGLEKLPLTSQQQALSDLTGQSLGGASEAGQMMLSRLRSSQGMIPGLLSSVQASMPPGLQNQAGFRAQGGSGSLPFLQALSGTAANPPQTPAVRASGLTPQMTQVISALRASQAPPAGSTPSSVPPSTVAPMTSPLSFGPLGLGPASFTPGFSMGGVGPMGPGQDQMNPEQAEKVRQAIVLL